MPFVRLARLCDSPECDRKLTTRTIHQWRSILLIYVKESQGEPHTSTFIPTRTTTQVKSHGQKFAISNPKRMTLLINQHAKSNVFKSQHKKGIPMKINGPKKKRIVAKHHTRKAYYRRDARSKIVKKVTFDDECEKAPHYFAGELNSLKQTTYHDEKEDPYTHLKVLEHPPFPLNGINNREDSVVLERFATFVQFLFDHLARFDGHMYQQAAAAIEGCYNLHHQGHPNFTNLSGAMEITLRHMVGEIFWTGACSSYYRHESVIDAIEHAKPSELKLEEEGKNGFLDFIKTMQNGSK